MVKRVGEGSALAYPADFMPHIQRLDGQSMLLALEAVFADLQSHSYSAGSCPLIAVLTALSINIFGIVILFFMLSAEVAVTFPRRTALLWVSIFTLLTIGLLFILGGPDALAFAPIYGGGYFFFAAFADQTRRAEEARRESQRLLEELQRAHQQLRVYAEQVEELAVAQEREMHDTLGHRLTVAAVQTEHAIRNTEYAIRNTQ